jgi:hypothetical protein
MRELPIACSLSATDLERRQTELAELGRETLVHVRRGEGVAMVLRFARDRDTRKRLERVVAAEAECCAFLDLRIADDEGLELTIDGPADAAPVIDELAAAFGSPIPAAP